MGHTVFDIDTLPINAPWYRASLYSTIVSTSFNDLMIVVDTLDGLLGRPGCYGRPGWAEISMANTCRKLQQVGAEHLVPKEEVLDHLAVVITTAELQQVVIEYLYFFTAVVTAGISGTGRFVRFYTPEMKVLPLRSCPGALVPELADEENVWIEAPLVRFNADAAAVAQEWLREPASEDDAVDKEAAQESSDSEEHEEGDKVELNELEKKNNNRGN